MLYWRIYPTEAKSVSICYNRQMLGLGSHCEGEQTTQMITPPNHPTEAICISFAKEVREIMLYWRIPDWSNLVYHRIRLLRIRIIPVKGCLRLILANDALAYNPPGTADRRQITQNKTLKHCLAIFLLWYICTYQLEWLVRWFDFYLYPVNWRTWRSAFSQMPFWSSSSGSNQPLWSVNTSRSLHIIGYQQVLCNRWPPKLLPAAFNFVEGITHRFAWDNMGKNNFPDLELGLT